VETLSAKKSKDAGTDSLSNLIFIFYVALINDSSETKANELSAVTQMNS